MGPIHLVQGTGIFLFRSKYTSTPIKRCRLVLRVTIIETVVNVRVTLVTYM